MKLVHEINKLNCCENQLREAIKANVLLQLDYLRKYECVRRAMDQGRLSLHGWVDHFENGQIDFLNESSELIAS